MEPGDLVQIRKNIEDFSPWAGDFGMVIRLAGDGHWAYSGRLEVLFADGIREVHPHTLESYSINDETIGDHR